MQIYYSADLKSEAKYLRDKLQQLTGRKFSILQKDYKGGKAIVLITKPISINKVSSEAYVLEISSDSGLMITGSDPAGVFYGIQSFMALLPIGIFQSPMSSIEVSNMHIEDAPRFHTGVNIWMHVEISFRRRKYLNFLISCLFINLITFSCFCLKMKDGVLKLMNYQN